MRPPRIAILVLFLTASLFIVFRALTTTRTNVTASYPSSPRASKSIFSFMYYNTPFSLFPPNAAISLTDDNSTSFAARPAAFGPKLAPLGLSGQLWVGSGFGEDGLDTDGELGCSDLPGWGSSNTRASLKNSFKVGSSRVASVNNKKSQKPGSLIDRDTSDDMPLDDGRNDNTDDYLTRKVSGTLARRDAWNTHADIQSIQEAAEIEGKVVLLKRGGCGFLEKVMWAQRRGAIAVIVGDNQKGGPLIQMFAHGDEVDNVTVPSVFTARTTALLLSSLTQPGSFIEDTIDDNGKPVLKVQQSTTSKRENTSRRSQATTRSVDGTKVRRSTEKKEHAPAPKPTSAGGGLLKGVFGWGTSSHHLGSDSRPPRSGRLDWVRVDDWDDEKDKLLTDTMEKSTGSKANEDGFVIGVQDWRDPDLMDNAGNQRSSHEKASPPSPGHAISASDIESGKHRGIMAKIFGSESGEVSTHTQTVVAGGDESIPPASPTHTPQPHQGLWVTITPTSSASPFFDTLLVLVISPLVTLTVVYALLVLRARIRRRRWRAPKSVVEQLPVRTYHTVAASPSASPRLPSSSAASPTTPLLQHSFSRPRPRSRTTTGVMESENFLTPSVAMSTPQISTRKPRQSEPEKGTGGFSAEWRKYMGRQVECVVCLEEYVDGVSRVMSLPCGHEFHADCITPWLTTRRRTCPICKGDVVRSLARGGGGGGGPRYEPYREDSDEGDDDAEGSGFTSADRESDLEQGTVASTARDAPEHRNRRGGFLEILSNSFNGRTRSPAQSPPPEDRSRLAGECRCI